MVSFLGCGKSPEPAPSVVKNVSPRSVSAVPGIYEGSVVNDPESPKMHLDLRSDGTGILNDTAALMTTLKVVWEITATNTVKAGWNPAGGANPTVWKQFKIEGADLIDEAGDRWEKIR